MFPCYSLSWFHPLLPPLCPQVCRTRSFYIHFRQRSNKSVKNWQGSGMWARGSNGEEVTRKVRVGSTMFVQISWPLTLPLVIRMASFLLVQGGTFTWEFYVLFKWGNRRSEWTSCFCCFFQTHSTWDIHYAKVPYFRVVYAEPHQFLLDKSLLKSAPEGQYRTALKVHLLIPFAYFEILGKFSNNSKPWMGNSYIKEAK